MWMTPFKYKNSNTMKIAPKKERKNLPGLEMPTIDSAVTLLPEQPLDRRVHIIFYKWHHSIQAVLPSCFMQNVIQRFHLNHHF